MRLLVFSLLGCGVVLIGLGIVALRYVPEGERPPKAAGLAKDARRIS